MPENEPSVILKVEGRIATITLNRPERRNGLTREMCERLYDLLQQIAGNAAVNVVVLTGAGDTFCIGADIAAFPAAGDQPLPWYESGHVFQISRMIHELPQVTLAVINGACAGAGFGWACACDLRLAGDEAILATAFLNIGMPGDMGTAWSLTQILGGARARELLFLPEKLTAAQAMLLGLVTRTYPDAMLREAADKMARILAARSPSALRGMKANLLVAEHSSLSEFTRSETAHHALVARGEDVKEAAAAFLEKRAPRFD